MNANTKQCSSGSLGLAWRAALIGAVLFSGRGVNAQLVSKPFSADQVVTTHEKTATAKVHMIETALRAEGMADGKKYITIIRYDRKVMWSLLPEEKLYFEMPLPAGAELAAAMKDVMKGVEVQHQPLGSEQVGGYHCDKSRMTVTWQGITSTTIEWAAKELGGFVVKKLDEKSGEITEYKNIQLGPQDPSLFELPAGFKKMST